MRRRTVGDEDRLVLGPIDRMVFRSGRRGKLRLARLRWRVSTLRRRGFVGIASLPIGDVYVDARHWLDWALLFGGMEQAEVGWVVRQLARATSAWDVGGHHGEYALAMGRALAERGSVHVFEAYPASAAVIERNVDANDLGGTIAVHAVAVAEEKGEVQLHLAASGSQNHSLREWLTPTGEVLVVPATTLDDVMDEHGVPDLVKLDIEGGELAAFRGATRLLEMRRTTFVFESERWDAQRSVTHAYLRSAGYRLTSLERGEEHEGEDGRMIIARPIS